MNQGYNYNEVTNRVENLKISLCVKHGGNDDGPKFIQSVKGNVENRAGRFISCEVSKTVENYLLLTSGVKLI